MALFADYAECSIRAKLHARLDALLAEGSDMHLCLPSNDVPGLSESSISLCRSPTAQQSADISMRLDAHWLCFPGRYAKSSLPVEGVFDRVGDRT